MSKLSETRSGRRQYLITFSLTKDFLMEFAQHFCISKDLVALSSIKSNKTQVHLKNVIYIYTLLKFSQHVTTRHKHVT